MTDSIFSLLRPDSVQSNKRIISPNDVFSQIYLINLERRPDRLQRTHMTLNKYNITYQVWPAVDGGLPENIRQYQEHITTLRTPGEWGYLMSWQGILKDAIQNKYPRILCFDDDIVFTKDFAIRFDHFIRNIGEEWKVLALGATQLPHLRNPINRNAWYHPNRTDGSFAVGVDQSVYIELLTETCKMLAPFDSGAMRSLYTKYPKQCYVAYPNLVITHVDDSDIRNGGKKIDTISVKVQWDLSLYDV